MVAVRCFPKWKASQFSIQLFNYLPRRSRKTGARPAGQACLRCSLVLAVVYLRNRCRGLSNNRIRRLVELAILSPHLARHRLRQYTSSHSPHSGQCQTSHFRSIEKRLQRDPHNGNNRTLPRRPPPTCRPSHSRPLSITFPRQSPAADAPRCRVGEADFTTAQQYHCRVEIRGVVES